MKPITVEYIRRFCVLMLLALFAWMFFYSPSDIYEIQVRDYVKNYQDRVKVGSIDSSETSLDDYIASKMKGSYTWSTRDRKIVEISGDSGAFLRRLVIEHRGQSTDKFFKKNRSPNKFSAENNYYFRSSKLPVDFLSQVLKKGADYLSIADKESRKSYFKFYKVKNHFMLSYVPANIKHPLRLYGYLLLVLSLLVYIFIPKPKVPDGAACYNRLSAVCIPDILAFSLWIGGWMFFFMSDDSAPTEVRYFLLFFFGIFALAIVFPITKYASSWYLFKDDAFEWSDASGVGRVKLDDIISVKPYKRQLPKWVAPLIILFGRGQPGATGMGILASTSAPEIGMEITTKSGKKIKVMANALESGKEFTKRFKELEKKVEGAS